MPTHTPARTPRRSLSALLAGALALALTAGMGLAANPAHAQNQNLISLAEAERIALEHVPGGVIEEIERDRERGVIVYEVEVRAPNGLEHELVIDARTGRIIKSEIDD